MLPTKTPVSEPKICFSFNKVKGLSGKSNNY
jgi:hypothetical protein